MAEFQHGLCGCFSDCGSCCMATWCPCIAHGKSKINIVHSQICYIFMSLIISKKSGLGNKSGVLQRIGLVKDFIYAL